ncbi:site-specific integrase [Burkholderia cepacia]|uniref:site-specific integrase n=1 Tax=Burkholderia cepacia TaxID=292 RepID=UPI000F5A2FEB|nr:site-specific integrase [Burkholderia cepacia]
MTRHASPSACDQQLAYTIDGFEFNPSDTRWRIGTADGTAPFNFENLPAVSAALRENIKGAFAALLLANAPERLSRNLIRVRSLLKFISKSDPNRVVDELTAADILNYSASLPAHQQYMLGPLQAILISWAKTGFEGLAADLVALLPTLKTKKHEVGAAVRTMDPNEGPLTDVEYESVLAAIHREYSTGKMSITSYALLNLAISLGCRPLQLAMIKTKDLSITHRANGTKLYILQVTRLKQGKNIRPRTLFKARKLTQALGLLLEKQNEISNLWAKQNNMDASEAPMFPSTSKRLRKSRTVRLGLDGHLNSSTMGGKVSRLLSRLNIASFRTGQNLELFQTRIRRTFGTRLGAEGLPVTVIAELMDHSWVDSSLVYVETRPEMIERIDKALALKIAPLAQAFSGTLSSRTETDRNQYSRVIHIDTQRHLESVGGCGKFEFCGLAAPLACYTCLYFNPWRDDIHEVLLERLLAERDELLAVSDHRIASINDRTIMAVAEVVNQCRDFSQEVPHEQGDSTGAARKGRRRKQSQGIRRPSTE